MTLQNYKASNNGKSTLNTGISAVIGSLILATGTRGLFPSTFPFFLTLEQFDVSLNVVKREIVKVTAGATEALTITRSAGYCPLSYTATTLTNTAQSFLAGDSVKLKFVSEILDDLNLELARLETAKIDKAGGTFTGLVQGAKSTNIASATTTNLATATGNEVHITGTSTITSFGTLAAGTPMRLIFDGILTLTHNATSLILPNNGNNITTAVGDAADFVSEGGGNWKCVWYQPATGIAIGSPDLSSYVQRYQSMTMGEDLVAQDVVYSSAANTVKRLYPSAMGTGASITTSPSHIAGMRSLPLSTAGNFLHITGGTGGPSALLYAQVRTINAGETDFANGSEANIYVTSNGVNWYDVCSIGVDKFLFVFQADTAGAGGGIKALVITVSGTTVTVGSSVAIEATGTISTGVDGCCCKLNTDKAAIFYRKDSDTFIYTQVLTVSGTTITTNTPYQVKGSAAQNMVACQLATDSACLIYNTGNVMYGRTITYASAVATVNAENTFGTDATGGSWGFGLLAISSSKVLVIYAKTGGGTRSKLANIGISGTTLTLSSTINLSNTGDTLYYGMVAIGTKYALVLDYASATSGGLFFIDVSAAAPVQISTQSLANSSNSNTNLWYACTKVSPWTYVVANGGASDGDYIVKLTPVSTARVGIMEGSGSNGGSANVTKRFQVATLSGLTTSSKYYTDDNGQPTLSTSLTAPLLGTSISTTQLILE